MHGLPPVETLDFFWGGAFVLRCEGLVRMREVVSLQMICEHAFGRQFSRCFSPVSCI
jgi:hypothetical protein